MRTVQLFCVLFSPCVHSRPSTVTYLIFVTVTKVITYSIDVYIYSILSESNVKGGTLCAAHHCLGIVCFSDFLGFFCFFISFYVVFFDSCIGIQECKLDVKKQMWQVNVIYSNKFQEIVKALMFLGFFLEVYGTLSQYMLRKERSVYIPCRTFFHFTLAPSPALVYGIWWSHNRDLSQLWQRKETAALFYFLVWILSCLLARIQPEQK